MKTIKTTTATLAILFILFTASCSTEQEVFNAPAELSERVDMEIEGNETEYIFVQNSLSGDAQLVNFDFYGMGANKLDIRVSIGNGRTLVFMLTDQNAVDLWEEEGSYSIYTTADMDDKQKFVTVEMETMGESTSHHSHVGNSFPRASHVNVFTVSDFNPATGEILCRIDNLPMIHTAANGNDVVSITGTFRGVVDFQN